MDDVTKETQHIIITQELTLARNTVYLFELRARIARKIGDEQGLQAAKTEMEKWMKVVDELERIAKELIEH